MEAFIAWIADIWDRITPVVIVNCYEKGVLLRNGHPIKDLDTGIHWFWPLICTAIIETVVENTENSKMQRVTTLDGHSVCVSAVVRFNIRHLRKYVLEVEGKDTFLKDGVSASVSRYIRTRTWDTLTDPEGLKELVKAVRQQGFKYGVEVNDVEFRDLVKVRAWALIN